MTRRSNSIARTQVRMRQAALGATIGTACLLLSACTGTSSPTTKTSTDAAPPTPVSATTTRTLSAADMAKAKVLETYQGFWKLQENAYSSGSLSRLPLNTYAVGQAAAGVRSSLDYYNSQHLVMRGKPVLSPKVSKINLSKKPYSATIVDCVDTTSFVPVDASTGKPTKLDSSVHRHLWTFTATFDNVQWYIVTGEIDRSGTC